MYTEEYDIRVVYPNNGLAIAWTGYVYRILERVSDLNAMYITWPESFGSIEAAQQFLETNTKMQK